MVTFHNFPTLLIHFSTGNFFFTIPAVRVGHTPSSASLFCFLTSDNNIWTVSPENTKHKISPVASVNRSDIVIMSLPACRGVLPHLLAGKEGGREAAKVEGISVRALIAARSDVTAANSRRAAEDSPSTVTATFKESRRPSDTDEIVKSTAA